MGPGNDVFIARGPQFAANCRPDKAAMAGNKYF
jgi:hypothetical protein